MLSPLEFAQAIVAIVLLAYVFIMGANGYAWQLIAATGIVLVYYGIASIANAPKSGVSLTF